MLQALVNFVNNFFRLFQWWVVCSPWQVGVRVRLGKHVRTFGPGVHWSIPYMDHFFVESVRLRVSGLETQTLTTRDGQTITLSGTYGYCLQDVRKLFDTLYQPEQTIRNLVESAIAQYVATHDFADCAPLTIVAAVEPTLDLAKYGLGCLQVRIVEYARVRTYRLIQGDRDTPWSGLTTDNRVDPNAPGRYR
jgi:SPFH domain / Band 7 family